MRTNCLKKKKKLEEELVDCAEAEGTLCHEVTYLLPSSAVRELQSEGASTFHN